MKKLWIFTAVIVVLGIVGGFVLVRSSTPVKTTQALPTGTPTPVPFELATWEDEAGFSFQYPKELTVDKNEQDNENYAHVELTHKDHPGNLIVWLKDPPKLWPTADAKVIDSELGGEPAKKIITDNTVAVGCLFEDLLFLIETTPTDKEYWMRVFDAVSGSFSFTTGSQSSSGEGPAVDVDETEVLE